MQRKHQRFRKMKNAGQLFLLLMLAVVIASQAQAESESTYRSQWQELVEYMASGGRRLRKECNDQVHSSVNPNNIDASFQRARREGHACRQVQLYLGIIEHGTIPQRQLARREIIDSYIDAEDSYGAMNAATFYVGLYGREGREDPGVIHEIRTKIFEVAFDNFASNPGYDPFWEKMVLGVHSRQNINNPAFQYYSASLFFQNYPRSSFNRRLSQIVEIASANVQRHMIQPIDQYMRQMDYKAVLMRLKPFWQEPDSQVYGDGLKWSVEAYVKMAEMVRRVGQGEEFRRRCWGRPTVNRMWVTQTIWEEYWNPNQPIDYNEAYRFFLEQADQLIAYMDRTVGAYATATRQAKALRQNPQQTFEDGRRFCW